MIKYLFCFNNFDMNEIRMDEKLDESVKQSIDVLFCLVDMFL